MWCLESFGKVFLLILVLVSTGKNSAMKDYLIQAKNIVSKFLSETFLLKRRSTRIKDMVLENFTKNIHANLVFALFSLVNYERPPSPEFGLRSFFEHIDGQTDKQTDKEKRKSAKTRLAWIFFF